MEEIQHETRGHKGTFYMEENGERLAELQYHASSAGEMTIYHTEVSEKLQGKGTGKELVKAAVDFARKQKLQVIATCPYAEKVIERTPEFQDVLK